jgi:predicted ester cyclase
MGAEENRAVHTRLTAAEDRHDLSRHEEYLNEDIVVYPLGAEPVVGIVVYRAMMEAQYAAFPDWHVVLDDQFVTDDRVACRWRVSGTHSTELFGFQATGRRIEYAGASLWEFDNGKACRGWIYADSAALMMQLGAPSDAKIAAVRPD